MRYYYQRPGFSFGPSMTHTVKNLLIISGVVFLLQAIVGRQMNLIFGLVPAMVLREYFLWQLVTYIFLHGGLFHLLFNLLALWMFGCELERYMGYRVFLRYFFITGVGAAICTVLITPNLFIPTIGMSGAIYGILLAYGWFFPNRIIYIYLLFPIKAKYFVMIFGAIELYASIVGTAGGIAHTAHLGGMIFGILYLNHRRIWEFLYRHYMKWKWSRLKRRYKVINGGKDNDNSIH
ncbi:MAG: rhomboid family intramembrane serine protease [Pseudomonadota bacterium]